MKVLMIDDDSFMQTVYKSAFAQENIEMIACSDGKEGVEKAKSENPAIILLDMLLPGMNGFDIIPLLKNDPLTKSIPIVVISALSQESDIISAKALGVDEYLPKDKCGPLQVIEKVKTMLIQRK